MLRDRIGIYAAVIIYIGIVLIGFQMYLPSGNFTVEDIVRDSEGQIYAAGGWRTGVYVYQLDADGKPKELYWCRSEAEEVQLFCRYANDHIYVAQTWYADSKQHFSIWESDGAGFSCVWDRVIEEDVTLTDFQVIADQMYVIGVDQQTENILVYSWKEGSDRLVRVETDFIPTVVCWGNEGLYTLSHDNHLYHIGIDGIRQEMELGDIVFFLTDGSGLYYQEKGSRDITYLFDNGLGGYTFRDMGDVWNIQYSRKAQNSAVLMSRDDKDRLLIVGQDGAYKEITDCTALDIGKKLRSLVYPFLIFTLAYIAVWTVIELFWHFVWKRKKLLYQTMLALAGFSGIWLVLTIISIWQHEAQEERQERMFLADTCMTVQKGRLLNGLEWWQGHLEYEGYQGSEQQKMVEETFSYSVMKNSSQTFYAREELVYNAKAPVFIFSEEASYGRMADTFYDTLALQKIRQCMTTGESQKFIDKVSGISYAMAVSRIGKKDHQVCLVLRVPVYGMDTNHASIHFFYITAFAGWVVIMLAIMIFLRYKWRNIEYLVTGMDKVSRGEYHVDSRKAPDNEFGAMWIAMERMCRNLQIQKYRYSETVAYLYQYAPVNFERLFAKEKLQDVEVGETVQIAATLGMISLIDKDTLLTGKLQRQYVQYVNQLMELLFSQHESKQAIFLQDGSNLENVKVIFKEDGQSALTAVKYSIDCMEELLEQLEDTYDTVPFILLHTAEFRCGLAGGSKQVYPYVTSLEMETLGCYINELKYSGARLVVTERTWQQVQTEVQGRYIGYVASLDGADTFRLYEILDACPQPQRSGKLKSRQDFENALKMYYENNLYQARSAFADIVKECPEDGISRWYVFACDRRFNGEDSQDEEGALFWK